MCEHDTLPNGTTATTQATGDNTTKVATDQFVNNQIAGGGSWPIAPQVAWFAYNSSGTTLVDSSGNGYNGTFDASPNAPSNTGTAILFNPTAVNDQGISIPYQALYGLKSLIVFYQPFFPSTNQNAQTTAYLITDQCYHGISLNLARFGQIGTVGEALLATDRLVGNAAVGFNVSSGGTSYEYPYGRPATGYLMQTALTNYFNCTAGAGQIGMSANGQARTGLPRLILRSRWVLC